MTQRGFFSIKAFSGYIPLKRHVHCSEFQGIIRSFLVKGSKRSSFSHIPHKLGVNVWGADCTSPPTCDRCGCKRKVEVGQKSKMKKVERGQPRNMFYSNVSPDWHLFFTELCRLLLSLWLRVPPGCIHTLPCTAIHPCTASPLHEKGRMVKAILWPHNPGEDFRDLTYFRARCSSPLPRCLTSPNPPRSKRQQGQLGIEPASLQVRTPPGYFLPDICYLNYMKHKTDKWSLGTDD